MFGAVIPVAIVVLGIGGYAKMRKHRGEMTPERTKIFNAALSGALKDPASLDKLAAAFSGEGLHEQSKILRQRSALKRLPPEVKEARAAVWRRAIVSKNKAGMLKLAAAYDAEGCTAAAMRLREIASGLPPEIPEPVTIDPPSPEVTEADQTAPEESESVVAEETGESEVAA